MGKRNSQLQELTVVAQNDYLTIVDTSAGQSKRVSVKTLVGNVDLGWVATGESWTFSSWSSATRIGIVTVPSDATTKYTPGMRVRFSQTTGGTKYAVITNVTATTLALFFPTGTTFVNETVTSPVYSSIKVPFGFNADHSIWKLSLTVSGQASVGAGGYVNPSGAGLTVPIGAWKMKLAAVQAQDNSGSDGQYTVAGLSTATNSFSHSRLKAGMYVRSASTSGSEMSTYMEYDVVLTSQTTFYAIITTAQVATSAVIGIISGQNGESYIEALCSYI